MPDDPYSLADLARLADVTPRTIRYYVVQGLLPSPEPAGAATRYGDGHLARLRLIRRLQRDHLPLAEIRLRLERMPDDDVEAALEAAGGTAPEPDQSPGETLAYVRALMTKAGVTPRVVLPPVAVRSIPGAAALHGVAAAVPVPRIRRLFMDDAADATGVAADVSGDAADATGVAADAATADAPDAPTGGAPVAAAPAPVTPRSVAGGRSTWERLVIVPDVEIHVRRPLGRLDNKRVEQLARIARELFDEEP